MSSSLSTSTVGWDAHNDLDAYLPSRAMPPVPAIELSGRGIFESLLVNAGFDHPGAVVASGGTYPFDMGNRVDDMLTMGTILIRDELIELGAFESYASSTAAADDDDDAVDDGGTRGSDRRRNRATTTMAGGWTNLAEEAFWINIRKYTDIIGGTMFLRDNTFKITVSTKK